MIPENRKVQLPELTISLLREDRSDAAVDDIAVPQCYGVNQTVLNCCLAAAFNAVIGGFSIGGFSGTIYVLSNEFKFTIFQTSALVSVLNLAAVIGSFFCGAVCDRYGRIRGFGVAISLFFLGSIIMVSSSSFYHLLLGRIVSGLGLGVCFTVVPLYVCEMSPKNHRGMFGSMKEIAINVGIILGYLSSWIFSGMQSSGSWRYMMSLGLILPPVMAVLCIYIMEESPRYLVMKGDFLRARAILLKVTGDEKAADTAFRDIQTALENEGAYENFPLKSILTGRTTPTLRRIFFIVIVVAMCQHLSAVDGILSYLPFALKAAGMSKQESYGHQLVLGIIKVTTLFPSMFLSDRVGRRPLLFSSVVGLVMAYGLISYGAFSKVVNLQIIGLYMFSCAFSIGIGPVTWLILPELLPLRVRASGMRIAVSLNRIVSFTSEVAFLPLISALSVGATYASLCLFMLLYAIFIYVYLPETKGIQLERMQEIFK